MGWSLRDLASTIWKFRDSRTGFILLWVLIVVFLGKAALDAYAEYALPARFYPAAFAVSVAALLAKSLLMPVKWHYLLNAEGRPLGFVKTGKIFYLSQISSYIPGGVWQYLEMGYRAARDGKDLEEVAHSIAFLHGVTVTSALFYALVAAGIAFPAYRAATFIGAAGLFVITLLSPEVVEAVKDRLGDAVSLSPYQPSRTVLAKLFALSLFIWLINGAFFYFLTASFVSIPAGLFLPVSAIFAVSWAAGFLVLVVPGGLGVREGSIVYLLSNLVPMPAVLAATAAARVLMLAAEVAMAAFFAALTWRGDA